MIQPRPITLRMLQHRVTSIQRSLQTGVDPAMTLGLGTNQLPLTTENLKISDDCCLELSVQQARGAGLAAIEYALAHPEHAPMLFLQLWSEHRFDALRAGWTNIPDEVFHNVDPRYATVGAC